MYHTVFTRPARRFFRELHGIVDGELIGLDEPVIHKLLTASRYPQ